MEAGLKFRYSIKYTVVNFLSQPVRHRSNEGNIQGIPVPIHKADQDSGVAFHSALGSIGILGQELCRQVGGGWEFSQIAVEFNQ